MNTKAILTLTGAKHVNVVWPTFWIVAYFGIVVGGGIYGCFVMANEGWLPGLPIGMFIAGFWTFPFVITAAILMWTLWMERFALAFAASAGGATGYAAASQMGIPDPVSVEFSPWLAFLCGAISGIVAAQIYLRSQTIADNDVLTADSENWTYSLKDLFVRFSILSALIAAWTFAIAESRSVRSDSVGIDRSRND